MPECILDFRHEHLGLREEGLPLRIQGSGNMVGVHVGDQDGVDLRGRDARRRERRRKFTGRGPRMGCSRIDEHQPGAEIDEKGIDRAQTRRERLELIGDEFCLDRRRERVPAASRGSRPARPSLRSNRSCGGPRRDKGLPAQRGSVERWAGDGAGEGRAGRSAMKAASRKAHGSGSACGVVR